MEVLVKCASVAVLGATVCLLIKKYNPELSLTISAVVSVLILTAAVGMLSIVEDLISCAHDMLGTSTTFIKPIVKCMGIGVISKFGADMCRDAAQTAMASSLEFAGTLCAATVAMPMIISMLKTIGTMI